VSIRVVGLANMFAAAAAVSKSRIAARDCLHVACFAVATSRDTLLSLRLHDGHRVPLSSCHTKFAVNELSRVFSRGRKLRCSSPFCADCRVDFLTMSSRSLHRAAFDPRIRMLRFYLFVI